MNSEFVQIYRGRTLDQYPLFYLEKQKNPMMFFLDFVTSNIKVKK